MTDERRGPADVRSRSSKLVRRSEGQTARAQTPDACGCGLPVAFDVDKHEFFCIGCGAATECTCRRSTFTSTVRPVKVT